MSITNDKHRLPGQKTALALLAVVVPVFYWKVAIFAGTLFHFDLIGLVAPTREFFFKNILHGKFPLWCDLIYSGFPLFSEGQLGPLYPLNYLFFTLIPPWISLNLSVLIHELLAIFGAYFYLRRNHRLFSATIGAITYAFCGYLVFHLVHLMLFQSACLLPWLYFFYDRYLSNGRRADILFGALVVGLMLLTGQQQGVVFPLIGLLVFTLTLAIESLLSKRKKECGRIIGALTVILILAAMMTCVVIYGVLDLLPHSVRSQGVEPSILHGQALTLDKLPRLASPAHNGKWSDNTWTLPDFVEKEIAVYLGLAVFLLTPLAFIKGSKRKDRAHLAVVIFGFLFMLGRQGPFAGILEQLPILNSMRIPTRFILPVYLSFAYLIASGLDALEKESGVKIILAPLIGFALWAAMAWGGAIHAYGVSPFHPDTSAAGALLSARGLAALKHDLALRTMLGAMLLLLTVCVYRLRNRQGFMKNAALFAMALVVFADLFLAGGKENPVAPKSVFGPFKTTDYLQKNLWDYRIYSIDNHIPYGHGGWEDGIFSFLDGIEALPDMTPLLFSIPSASGWSSLVFSRNQRVYDSLSVSWLRQMSVRYLLAQKNLGLNVALDAGRVKVYHIPGTAPKYALASKIVPVPDAETAFLQAGELSENPVRTAWIESADGAFPSVRISEGEKSLALLVDESDFRKIRVRTDEPAYLVIRESYHPDWRAIIDGTPAPIYRTNYLFFGVEVPPGIHEVALVFRPAWFKPLLLISVFSFLICLGLV